MGGAHRGTGVRLARDRRVPATQGWGSTTTGSDHLSEVDTHLAQFQAPSSRRARIALTLP